MSLEDKISQLIVAIDRLNTSINKLSVRQTADVSTDKLVPLTRWGEIHQWPTTPALRNIVFNKDYNGAKVFVVKLGRRVYIDQQKFFEWTKSNPDFSSNQKSK